MTARRHVPTTVRTVRTVRIVLAVRLTAGSAVA